MDYRNTIYFILVTGLFLVIFCRSGNEKHISEKIIAMERAALDRWGKGDPQGYLEIYAQNVTYFDPDTEQRVDGFDAMEQRLTPLTGQIKIERYEMINPKVQIHGNTAVLTFNLIDYEGTSGGTIQQNYWNSTEVYSLIKGEWQIIHSHWSNFIPRSDM